MTEAGKSRKQRRKLKQMHADLVVLGFDGSYGRVAAFARDWRADRQRDQQTTGRGTFVPLSFRPGEAFQFDWSEDFAVLGGERTKLQVAHIKLSHSRAFLVRAYLLQTREMLFDAHWHGFRVFGGVPERGIYDSETSFAIGSSTMANAPFAEFPPAFKQLHDLMLRKPGGDREMVDILALVLHHDEQAVLVAVEMALAEGLATKTHVLNLLHRLIDGKTIGGPDIDTPQALILQREPEANVERYDGLRVRTAGGRHAS